MNVPAGFGNGERSSPLPASCCTQQSLGAGRGVTAAFQAPFLGLDTPEVVLSPVGLSQEPWSWGERRLRWFLQLCGAAG